MDKYVLEMIDNDTAAKIRARISDSHTLPVDAYNPEGFESLPTYVLCQHASATLLILNPTNNIPLLNYQDMARQTSIQQTMMVWW